jgi:hypothetical protein
MIFQSHLKEIFKTSKRNGGNIQRKTPKIPDQITGRGGILFIK